MKTTNEMSLGEILESALDSGSVQLLCETLREVCFAKEQHVEENWQDSDLAKLWNDFAKRFDQIAGQAAATGHPSFAVRC